MSDTAGSRSTSSDDASLLDLFTVLSRRWRSIVRVTGGATLFALVLAFVMPSKYTATTAFIPEVSSSLQVPSGLASLAGELGFGMGAGSTVSPRFFADVLVSRAMMDRVLRTRFAVPGSDAPDSLPLLDILEVDGRNTADSLETGRTELNRMISTDVDAETSIITVKVTTRDRELSAQVTQVMMQYLDEFNTTQRRTSAREQRQFVERRLGQSAEELRAAELGLRSFYEKNRSWQQSPQLVYEEGQLHRRVDIVQDVFLTLNREYEKARIDELNDTPALTIIDPATPPYMRASPRRGLLLLLGVVLGAGAGVMWALLLDYVDRARTADPRLYALIVKVWPFSRFATR